MAMRAVGALAESVETDGFACGGRVLDADECARLVQALKTERRTTEVWTKAMATTSRVYFDAATDSRILDLVRPILGSDIILWGALVSIRQVGAVHPFHTDVESSRPEGGFVSVWIGLENSERRSGLRFVPGSHRFGTTIQEWNHRRGLTRGDRTDETVLAAAQAHEITASIVEADVADGEALVFDGRVWHGSNNQCAATRTALLLQFARADLPVRLPDRSEWPFKFQAKLRPPVLVVSGRAPAGVNRIVVPPERVGRVANAAHLLPAAPVEKSERFGSIPHFRGRTANLDLIDGHSSVLAAGHTPHSLHAHIDEEILVVVSGEAELQTAADARGTGLTRTIMRDGDFAFYPAFQHHTIRNAGDTPLMYTMFKWRSDQLRSRPLGKLALVRVGASLFGGADASDLARRQVLETPTRWLDRVHCHLSIVLPGDGYAAHADTHDVALVLLAGTVETLGQTVSAPAVLYHPAGEPHGLTSVGVTPARYLVFEFENHRSPSLIGPLARMSRSGITRGKAMVRRGQRKLGKFPSRIHQRLRSR